MHKKTSKFEGEDKSNEIPLLHHGIFFSFTRIFLYTIRKIPYNFFVCPVRISRVMNAKKNRNSKVRVGELHTNFYNILDFFFPCTSFFLWTFRKIPNRFLHVPLLFREFLIKKKNLIRIFWFSAMQALKIKFRWCGIANFCKIQAEFEGQTGSFFCY